MALVRRRGALQDGRRLLLSLAGPTLALSARTVAGHASASPRAAAVLVAAVLAPVVLVVSWRARRWLALPVVAAAIGVGAGVLVAPAPASNAPSEPLLGALACGSPRPPTVDRLALRVPPDGFFLASAIDVDRPATLASPCAESIVRTAEGHEITVRAASVGVASVRELQRSPVETVRRGAREVAVDEAHGSRGQQTTVAWRDGTTAVVALGEDLSVEVLLDLADATSVVTRRGVLTITVDERVGTIVRRGPPMPWVVAGLPRSRVTYAAGGVVRASPDEVETDFDRQLTIETVRADPPVGADLLAAATRARGTEVAVGDGTGWLVDDEDSDAQLLVAQAAGAVVILQGRGLPDGALVGAFDQLAPVDGAGWAQLLRTAGERPDDAGVQVAVHQEPRSRRTPPSVVSVVPLALVAALVAWAVRRRRRAPPRGGS